MPEIISIGSAIIDIFIQTDTFEMRKEGETTYLCQSYGEKIEVDRFDCTTGGGGSNTAVGFARRGYQTAVVSETGKDIWSNFVLTEMAKENVSTELVVVEKKEETGGSVILVGADGGRTVMVHRGAASLLDPADIPQAEIKDAKWIHLSSISGRIDTLDMIFSAVKKSGTGLSWNPGSREIEHIAKGGIVLADVPCTVFMVNKEEWAEMSQVQDQALQSFEYVVITNGKNGGQVYQHTKLVHTYKIEQVPVVEETGAGDAFIVGYIDAHLQGKSVEEACEEAKQNAASVVQYVGAKEGLLRK